MILWSRLRVIFSLCLFFSKAGWTQSVAFDSTYSPAYASATSCVHPWKRGYLVAGGGYDIAGEHSYCLVTDQWGVPQLLIDSTGFQAGSSWSQPTGDGGFISADQKGNQNVIEAVIRKYDSLGNWQWSTRINRSTVTMVDQVIQLMDGGYIAVGKHNVGFNDYSSFLCKLDANGDSTWSIELDTTNESNLFTSVHELPAGELLVRSGRNNNGDATLVRVQPDGTGITFYYFPGFEIARRNSFAEYDATHTVVLGYSQLSQELEIKILDQSCSEITHVLFSPPESTTVIPCSIEGEEDEGYIIACNVYTSNRAYIWLMRLDHNLQIKWQVTYDHSIPNGYYDERVSHAVFCNDHGVIFSGSFSMQDTINGDYQSGMMLVKLDSLGRFAAPGNFTNQSPLLFPNPAGQTVNIIYPYALETDVIVIYDLLGRIVRSIPSNDPYANNYSHNSIFVGDLPAGAYFCRVLGNPSIENLGKLIVTGSQ